MSSDSDYYGILEAEDHFTAGQITQRYRQLCLRYHPDRSPDQKEHFQLIQRAYEVLSDAKKRVAYDRWRETAIEIPFDVWFQTGMVTHWSDPQTKRLVEGEDERQCKTFQPKDGKRYKDFRNYEI